MACLGDCLCSLGRMSGSLYGMDPSLQRSMFHAVTFFRALRIIESVDCSHKVASDATDALKVNTFTDNNIAVALTQRQMSRYVHHAFFLHAARRRDSRPPA